MQPTVVAECGLTDLLERILDKGLVLYADMLITLAGVPLVGVSLRAALAGMETMVRYGMLVEWDERTRDLERIRGEQYRAERAVFADGERVLSEAAGAYWCSQGIYRAWRPGHIYVTDRRVFACRQHPFEVLVQMPYEMLERVVAREEKDSIRDRVHCLYLVAAEGEAVRLRATQAPKLREAIEGQLRVLGLAQRVEAGEPVPPEHQPPFLSVGEAVTHCGETWHLVGHDRAGGSGFDWRRGVLYLTNMRLVWLDGAGGSTGCDVALDCLAEATINSGEEVGPCGGREALAVVVRSEGRDHRLLFAAEMEALGDWLSAATAAIELQRAPLPDGWETCPRCRYAAPGDELLNVGCSLCGWASPRMARRALAPHRPRVAPPGGEGGGPLF